MECSFHSIAGVELNVWAADCVGRCGFDVEGGKVNGRDKFLSDYDFAGLRYDMHHRLAHFQEWKI
ncbi:hypothetical protein [Planomicrobium sp. YIM 101495]|uniref:hypothetical protein n=1 Tax=Planomicrobium sp. YIM 101495 TaxID=2665160 RepID=UPI0012B956C8|nr:hypothetical protein [Planomicrobium sp. YIM 101495]MTD29704.1 hypothetical protein [Planomicrobium sp. YIM 101495]